MTSYENLARALALLTTEIDETDIAFQAGNISVCRQTFDPHCDNDREVLSILMADKEFGFFVSTLEDLARELRKLQKVWFDEADRLRLVA